MSYRRAHRVRKDGYSVNPEYQARVLGDKAFKDGLPRTANPWGFHRFHGKNWDSGWIKAKLAQEQGKPSL